MYISKKTIATVKRDVDNGFDIDMIVRDLDYRADFRTQVISVIGEYKGEQFLVDNAERLGYPEHKVDHQEISSVLHEFIRQWFALQLDDSEEKLRATIEESIIRHTLED